jgi:hypothetical protein
VDLSPQICKKQLVGAEVVVLGDPLPGRSVHRALPKGDNDSPLRGNGAGRRGDHGHPKAQFAEQWQKAWTDAMAFWTKIGRPSDTERSRRRR